MSSKLPNALSLKRFLLRQQAIKLYKEFIRITNQVEDKSQRTELQRWVREDFQANKHHTDEEIIKMHLSRGKKALKQLGTTVALPGIRS
jgi:hypothetical protein